MGREPILALRQYALIGPLRILSPAASVRRSSETPAGLPELRFRRRIL